MPSSKTVPSLALCALLGCASTPAPTVLVDRHIEYDFAGKETYAWTVGVPSEIHLMQQQIVASVDAELAALGLAQVQSSEPDLWVSTVVKRRDEVDGYDGKVAIGVYYPTSFGAVGVNTRRNAAPRSTSHGALLVHVLDGPTRELVWRSTASGVVPHDPQDTLDTLRSVIGDAFTQFPTAAP